MPCRGVFFAISEATTDALLRAGSDAEVMEIVEDLEDAWIEEDLCETDKAWDAMHRALSDGTLDRWAGEAPLSRTVLGGRHLLHGDDHLVVLVTRAEVVEVARALARIDEAELRRRYDAVVPRDYAPEYGPEDFAYTWAYFEEVKAFYARAASVRRAALFTVDQ